MSVCQNSGYHCLGVVCISFKVDNLHKKTVTFTFRYTDIRREEGRSNKVIF